MQVYAVAVYKFICKWICEYSFWIERYIVKCFFSHIFLYFIAKVKFNQYQSSRSIGFQIFIPVKSDGSLSTFGGGTHQRILGDVLISIH